MPKQDPFRFFYSTRCHYTAQDAVELFSEMVRGGHEPDVITYSTITGSLCKDRLVNDAMEFLSEMVDRVIPPDVVTYSSILHGFCNLGQLNEATRLFKEMVSVLVDGLCKEGMVSEAQCVFETMTEKGAEPDAYTSVHCLDGWVLFTEPNG